MILIDSLKTYRYHFIFCLLLLMGVYSFILPDMVKDWYKDDNYSHGFLVPVIVGYFLFQNWNELKKTPVSPNNWGLLIVICGIVQLAVAWLGTEYFTMRSSFIVIVTGIVMFWLGSAVLKLLAFPLAYLFFMVPIPYIIYDALAFPLKLFVTKISVAFLKMIDVVVLREGNIIIFPTTTLEVADACSGIRSLMSLLALTVAYAFFLQTTSVKRWILIISAIPIAIVTNSMRVIITGILAQWWGTKAAEGFFHEFAGIAVFALAMLMMVMVGMVLKRAGK